MREEIRKLPLYCKGMEIGVLIRQITELADEDNEDLQRVCVDMIGNACDLAVKVAGAETVGLYDIRMENAALIRRSARELVVSMHGLDMFGFKHPEYYSLIREAVEEYRLLFIDWVADFDDSHYVVDRWGLFNPNGVGPYDRNPDDDPFDPDDLDL